MLKYMKFQKTCDFFFAVFVVAWIISRHILYAMVVLSIYRDMPKQIDFGCYSGPNGNVTGPFEPPAGFGYLLEPFLARDGTVCCTRAMQNVFFGVLLILQVLLIIWLGMIVQLVIKVMRGTSTDDPRSDDEEEAGGEHSDEQMEDVKGSAYERMSAEEIQRSYELRLQKASKASTSSPRPARRGHANASGVSLPMDRKELLGRIGCDKGS